MFVTSPKFHKYSMRDLNVLINVHIPVMCNSCGSLNSECVYVYNIPEQYTGWRCTQHSFIETVLFIFRGTLCIIVRTSFNVFTFCVPV